MSLSLYDVSVPGMIAMLGNMRAYLDKADARGETEGDLLEARLAPDMHPFMTQFTIATTMGTGIARLTGAEPPQLPEIGPSFASIRANLDAAIAFLKGLDRADFQGAEERTIEMRFPNGMGMRYRGLAYLNGFVLPNFYFHATTAYAILRSRGVPMAKGDYLANMAEREMLAAE